MAAKKKTAPKVPKFKTEDPQKKRSREILFGGFLILTGTLLFVAFGSYFFSWKIDQSNLSQLANRGVETQNILRKLGAEISHLMIYEGVGIAAFIFAYLLLSSGLFLFFNLQKKNHRQAMDLGYLLHSFSGFNFSKVRKDLPFFRG